MCYILGVLAGDGYVIHDRHNWIIGLGVKDKIFTEKFKEKLENIGVHCNIYESKSLSRVHKRPLKIYQVQGNSKILFLFWKSLTWERIFELIKDNENLIYSFLCGLYESDGSLVQLEKHGTVLILLVNTDMGLINLATKLLEKLGIKYSISCEKKKHIKHPNWKKACKVQITDKREKKKRLSYSIESCYQAR